MIDREKVIKGLYCCAVGCRGWCPYKDEPPHCTDYLAKDALELLKAQEPRVLTLDELEGWDGVFMIESRATDRLVWASWYAEYVSCGEKMCRMLDIDAEVDDRLRRAYGYLWRCWSARPTKAQRKAAAWNDH